MAELIKRKQIQDSGGSTYHASRNGNNQPSQALRRGGNIPTNEAPFDIPYDGEIYALAAGDRDQDPANATWDLQVEVDGVPVVTLNKPAGQSSIAGELVTPIPVAEGSLLSIWMRNENQGIRDPRGSVYFRKPRS